MDREGCLELVRTLTRPVVELFCPAEAGDFEDDFAIWSMSAGAGRVAERTYFIAPPAQALDTTLVAGMFFEVLVEASRLPSTTPERVSFVRKMAKDYLVTRLAGQITLSQFYRLLNLIEEKVGHYFEHLECGWTGSQPPSKPVGPAPGAPVPIKGEELRRALAQLDLPLKGRRKLTPETLWEFLRTGGTRWFRLLDFEAHFQVNKKTAWSYLNQLLQAGLLEHNGEKANRVRYVLASRFRAEPLPSPPA